MPTQTLITAQTLVGPYPSLPVATNLLDLVWITADIVNGNYFIANQSNTLLVWNTDVVPHNLTIMTQPDHAGRSGDALSYVVGAGVISGFNFSKLVGWADEDGNVCILGDGSPSMLLFAILNN